MYLLSKWGINKTCLIDRLDSMVLASLASKLLYFLIDIETGARQDTHDGRGRLRHYVYQE